MHYATYDRLKLRYLESLQVQEKLCLESLCRLASKDYVI